MKPFWSNGKSAVQRALGWFWIPTGRSCFLTPLLYPELTADEMKSTLNKRQRIQRKKRNQTAELSRRRNR